MPYAKYRLNSLSKARNEKNKSMSDKEHIIKLSGVAIKKLIWLSTIFK
jgi:hypothetical protein